MKPVRLLLALAIETAVVLVSCTSAPIASAPAAVAAGKPATALYTAEVVTPPSAATKNEALVRPTLGKVPDCSETQFCRGRVRGRDGPWPMSRGYGGWAGRRCAGSAYA